MMQSFQVKLDELNSYPLYMGILDYEHHNEPVNRPHGIGSNQIGIVVHNSGELILDDKRSLLHEGDLFVIRKNQGHIHRALDKDWTVNIIGINGKFATELFDFFHLYSGAYTISDPEIMNSYISELLDTLTFTKRSEQLLARSQILYSMLNVISSHIEVQTSTSIASSDEIIGTLCNYLEAHYREDINLSDLSRATNRTPEYLCSIFKKSLGIPIITYLNNLRVAQSRLLLERYPELTVAQIGEMCGFNSSSYFGKVFKKVCSITPQQFRISRFSSLSS